MRRDIGPHTPAFTLSDEQLLICHKQAALGWLDATLEEMHRAHCYAHRPIVGLARSLDGIGFAEDWDANRDAHMAVARDAWAAANAPVWSVAA